MRALCLSGGGANGSYEVGAIEYLVLNQKRDYQIFAGVSVGAINAAYLAHFKPDRLDAGVNNLGNMWRNLSTDQIYKRWFPFGRLHALWKQSLYDSSPVQKMMRSNLKPEIILASGNKLRLGAVCVSSGQYEVFDENYHDIPGAVLASSAFPLAFSPIKLDGKLYLDGGIRTIIPLTAAIKAGADEVDVIITQPKNEPEWQPKNPKTLDLALRTLDIMTNEIVDNDILVPKLYNTLAVLGQSSKKLVKINIIRPLKPLGDSLDFSPKLNIQRLDLGYNDAQNQFKI